MTGTTIAARLLRLLAIAIAVAAVMDPAITSRRIGTPEISVVAANPAHDSAQAARVVRALGRSFSATTAPLSSADATIIVGDQLPTDRNDLATPIVAVPVDPATSPLSIERVRAPVATAIDARVPLTATVHVRGMIGRVLVTTLRLGGLVVDRNEYRVPSNDQVAQVPLTFVPTALGAAALSITATLDGENANRAAHVDLAVDVTSQRWSVLFYDPRPSWMSTFVRRAIEDDPRFTVTSHVVTSRNISTDAGTPPLALDDLAAISRYDAIVVGAADALSEREVAALDAVLRRRGASVVLLLDQKASGPFIRLAGSAQWLDNGSGPITAIAPVSGDSAGLKGSEVAWPTVLPPGAVPVARYAGRRNDSAAGAPAVWQMPVGAGRLVVSGALDAWRYRDAALSAFDPFWRNLIAAAASASPRPLNLELSCSVAAPAEPCEATVTVRDAALGGLPARAAVALTLEGTSGALISRISLWPDGSVGSARATFRAPDRAGSYRLVASARGERATAPLIVSAGAEHAMPDDHDLVAMWVGAHGGSVVPMDQLSQLGGALVRAIHPTAHPLLWHPMRSFWWLLPFAGALSAEWWWRRRRGLP
jgi:hypothetical protein